MWTITFDTMTGDLMALRVHGENLRQDGDIEATKASITFCDEFRIQKISTSASGQIGGSFRLYYDSSVTEDISSSITAEALKEIIERSISEIIS